MKLHDHIVALERASTANRALDGDTIEILGLAPQGFKRRGGSQPELWTDGGPGLHARDWLAPKMTSLMDDAALMIPPGWRIRSLSDATGLVRYRCMLERNDQTVIGYGCNRATAMLAASMRARAVERGSPMPQSEEFSIEAHEQHACPEVAREVA